MRRWWSVLFVVVMLVGIQGGLLGGGRGSESPKARAACPCCQGGHAGRSACGTSGPCCKSAPRTGGSQALFDQRTVAGAHEDGGRPGHEPRPWPGWLAVQAGQLCEAGMAFPVPDAGGGPLGGPGGRGRLARLRLLRI